MSEERSILRRITVVYIGKDGKRKRKRNKINESGSVRKSPPDIAK